MIGGFFGDFVKGRLIGKYPHQIEQGIRLHRHIDSFTDQHQTQKSIKAKLPPRFCRYSGIVADMMCDHFLTQEWRKFYDGNLDEFNRICMDRLANGVNIYSDKANWVFSRMQQGSWLTKYGDLEYVANCLSNIGSRIRFDNPLHESPRVLPTICEQIEADCLEILNDTKQAVTQWRQHNMPELSA